MERQHAQRGAGRHGDDQHSALGTPKGAPLPGFQQGGNFKAGKLLGFLPLPDMRVPTFLAADATRGADGNWKDAAGVQRSANYLDFSDEPTRQLFLPGGANVGKHGVTGFAMIGSKYERKVTFVDLQPLFDYFNGKYFGTRADFDVTQKNAGPAPNQWPFTFDVAPESKPVLVTTVAFADLPTAVYAGYTNLGRKIKPLHALVATMNGKLHQFDVGGLIDKRAVSAADIRELGTIDVGRNITSIVQSKHDATDSAMTDVVMVSRGDREVQFVTYKSGAGVLERRIADARMNDPISVYDSTRSKYIVTVADYTGRRVLSYRYGPFEFKGYNGSSPPIGPGPDGKSAFDFGGSWATAGRPFAVTATNVN